MAELTGVTAGFPGGTSNVYTTPFPVRVGQRARGVSGEEYIFVDFAETAYSGMPVLINADFTASLLTAASGRGPIGIVVAGATSNNGGWVQVYGRVLMQVGINAASPSDAANGPTTLSTSAQTIFIVPTSVTSPAVLGYTSGNVSTASGKVVLGITVASDASPGDVSATTSATSHIGSEIAVFLNYPHIVHLNFGE